MNNPIVNYNQKENQAGIIRIERNLTEIALWLALESRKIFEIRSIFHSYTDEQGKGYEVEIKVLYHPELGTLTTYDQRVFYCLVELWQEQEQPEIGFFSLRQLAEMLGVKWSGSSTAKSLEESLHRLRGVLVHWNGAFFDFSENKYIHINNPFTVLNHLETFSTNEKVIRDKVCEFAFDKHVVRNFLNNGTRPINRLVIQSLNSPIEQLLYTLLDREMYGTNEYSILTTNLFQKLGLTADRWQYLSRRVEALIKCREGILYKPTSYGETFNYFEIEPSRTKDKKLVVKRTGAKKIDLTVDLGAKKLQVLPDPKPKVIQSQNKADTATIKASPSSTTEKAKEVQIQANTSRSEDILTQDSRGDEKPKAETAQITPLLAFITLFSELFPKAKPVAELKKMRNVRAAIDDFFKYFSLEQAKDFLSYAKRAGESHNVILEAQTPNYLFTGGKNSVYEAWQRQKHSEAEAAKQAERLDELVLAEYKKTCREEYKSYFDSIVSNWSEELQRKFSLFHKEFAEEKLKEAKPNLQGAFRQTLRRAYLGEAFIQTKIKAFCSREGLAVPPVSFNEWINAFRQADFEAFRYSKIGR